MFLYLQVLPLLVCLTIVAAQRTATVDELQPTASEQLHTIWVNGPTNSGKLTQPNWPSFSAGSSSTDTLCTTHDDRFTGYTTNGQQYCSPANSALDDNPHLILHSGRVGIVLNAKGASGLPVTNRNLFPKIGSVSVSQDQQSKTSKQIYDTLPAATTDISLTTTCSGGETTKYSLGTSMTNEFVQIGLVRQGHAVTQLTLSALQFEDSSGGLFGPCGPFVSHKDPANGNCNGASNWPCPSTSGGSQYTSCVGFVQGSSWGKCWNECTDTGSPEVWGELTVWGDSISFRLAWDSGFTLPAGCTGEIQMSFSVSSVTTIKTATLSASGDDLYILFVHDKVSGVLSNVADHDLTLSGYNAMNPIQVTKPSGSSASIVARSTTHDVFVEVPSNTAKCGYNMECKNIPLIKVPIILTNPHPTQEKTLRLSFSRNFETRDNSLTNSRPGSEITGLVGQLYDTASNSPSGIPCHISKNWHSGSTASYWAGFDGSWWTVNCFLRMPPDSTIPLTLAINYERFGGVSAFSHGQLSIVGYSDNWLWEEAALGCSGENICFDPLGTHTRAAVTDIRVKLFDGKWKENVGGGDFVSLFGPTGALQYLKQLDPQLHSNGPCLTNASYTSLTLDESLSIEVKVSGGRTDDMVRVFFHVRVKVLKDVPKFTRLVLFQFGSEMYSYNANFDKFIVGSSGGAAETHTKVEHPRTCTGNSRASDRMYAGGPFRTDMDGTAPWWFSYGANAAIAAADKSEMVVGDRGLVIREFSARLNGIDRSSPSFSILCDKVELGTPSDLLELKQNDYVDMKLELLVVPRAGSEYNAALSNSGNSNTLQFLQSMTSSWEKVRAQAVGGKLQVTASLPLRAKVESNYPIRVCATGEGNSGVVRQIGDTGVLFVVETSGNTLGYVPIVICHLDSFDVAKTSAQRGLWIDTNSDGGFTLLNQETTTGTNDFYQINYDRQNEKYEVVYNMELSTTSTTIAFGSDPALWTAPKCTSDFTCNSETHHLKSNPSTITCTSLACQSSDCCDTNPICTDFACNSATHHLKPNPSSITCSSANCQTSECCNPNTSCSGFSSCSSNKHLKSSPDTISCASAGGCQVLDCCDDNPTCADTNGAGLDFVKADCAANTHLKDVLTYPCAGAACVSSDCCEANPTCADTNGANLAFIQANCHAGWTLKTNLAGSCTTSSCTNNDCCTINACSATEVANSDLASVGSITGNTGSAVTVTCSNAFYVAGTAASRTETATCNGEIFSAVVCAALTCNTGNTASVDSAFDNAACIALSSSTALKSDTSLSDLLCSGAACTVADCCNQVNPSCAGFTSCNSATHTLKSNPSSITCLSATCTNLECCDSTSTDQTDQTPAPVSSDTTTPAPSRSGPGHKAAGPNVLSPSSYDAALYNKTGDDYTDMSIGERLSFGSIFIFLFSCAILNTI